MMNVAEASKGARARRPLNQTLRRLAALCGALVCLLSCPAFAGEVLSAVEIEGAWSRETPPGTTVGVGYMTIRNDSSTPERLLGATSAVARTVEMHTSVMDGDINRMQRANEGYAIPAHGQFVLSPGGAHLMLIGLEAPLRAGTLVPLTLEFENAGQVQVELHVESLDGAAGQSHSHH